jgi:hypothetical protein
MEHQLPQQVWASQYSSGTRFPSQIEVMLGNDSNDILSVDAEDTFTAGRTGFIITSDKDCRTKEYTENICRQRNVDG